MGTRVTFHDGARAVNLSLRSRTMEAALEIVRRSDDEPPEGYALHKAEIKRSKNMGRSRSVYLLFLMRPYGEPLDQLDEWVEMFANESALADVMPEEDGD